jgi:hypothetical protein
MICMSKAVALEAVPLPQITELQTILDGQDLKCYRLSGEQVVVKKTASGFRVGRVDQVAQLYSQFEIEVRDTGAVLRTSSFSPREVTFSKVLNSIKGKPAADPAEIDLVLRDPDLAAKVAIERLCHGSEL